MLRLLHQPKTAEWRRKLAQVVKYIGISFSPRWPITSEQCRSSQHAIGRSVAGKPRPRWWLLLQLGKGAMFCGVVANHCARNSRISKRICHNCVPNGMCLARRDEHVYEKRPNQWPRVSKHVIGIPEITQQIPLREDTTLRSGREILYFRSSVMQMRSPGGRTQNCSEICGTVCSHGKTWGRNICPGSSHAVDDSRGLNIN